MATKNAKGPESSREPDSSEDQARRDFLKKAGRFAIVTPPAITLLLGTSLNSRAIAIVKRFRRFRRFTSRLGIRRFEPLSHWPAGPKIGRLDRRLFVAPTPHFSAG